MQDYFQVVNHEIEHHADVGAPIRKWRKPMRLDEARMREARLERAEHRIKTLDMSHLQNETALRGQLRELAGLRGVVRNRFFDQQMFCFFEQWKGDGKMRIRRRSDGSGVDQLCKVVERGGRAHLVLLRN